MKPQKFADESDYVKYSILRHLLQQGLSCTVCWMMTRDNSRGRRDTKTAYLKSPDLFKNYDPDVFDYLKEQVDSGDPDIHTVDKAISPIRRCTFYWPTFPSKPANRDGYFKGCLDKATNKDLVFVDPDTGPVPNEESDREPSEQHIRWNEITRVYCAGKSVVVFNSLRGTTFENNLRVVQRTRRLQNDLPSANVTVLRTCNLAFYFVVHEVHWNDVGQARAAILQDWGNLPLWQAI